MTRTMPRGRVLAVTTVLVAAMTTVLVAWGVSLVADGRPARGWLLIAGAVAVIGAAAVRGAARTVARVCRIESVLVEVRDRQRRDSHKVAAIAGTVGRSAPIIRAIHDDVGQLSAGATDARSPAVQNVLELEDYPLPSRASVRRPDIRVAVILDEFSELAFRFEWTQFAVTPANWRETLDSERIDLLFVESAWNGNSGTWKYQVVGTTAPRADLVELVQECRRRRIPTVFWNKEDPPHFPDFLRSAALFDHVFTTDVDCVPRYREALGHCRVDVLPFAAQPTIHNPARIGQSLRDREVAFGGMYFRHKYPERREQLATLLPAAADRKLDIFSRNLGVDPNYEFPDAFKEFVRGGLTYRQMLTAYHRYRVLINVNSVVDSSSMCARRIFEVTASGASVLTAPSPAIAAFFSEAELVTVADEQDARDALSLMLDSPEHRERMVHRGQRRIWREHTYSQRVAQVLASAGMADSVARPSVSVLAPTMRPEQVDDIVRTVGKQSYGEIELILMTHGFEVDESELRAVASASGVRDLVVISRPRSVPLGSCLNDMVRAASGAVVTKMDDDDFYGVHYVEDLVHARMYSSADVVGKAAAYIHFAQSGATVISYGAHEHRYTDFVRGATLTCAADLLREIPFDPVGTSEDSRFLAAVLGNGGTIYAADRFNFVIRRNSLEQHTWKASDRSLMASGRVVLFGDPVAHAEV